MGASMAFYYMGDQTSVEGVGASMAFYYMGVPNFYGRGWVHPWHFITWETKPLWKRIGASMAFYYMGDQTSVEGVGASMAFYYMGDQTSVGEDWCIHGILLHGRPNLCGRGVGASMTFYYMGGPNFYGREWVHPWHFTTWGTKHLS